MKHYAVQPAYLNPRPVGGEVAEWVGPRKAVREYPLARCKLPPDVVRDDRVHREAGNADNQKYRDDTVYKQACAVWRDAERVAGQGSHRWFAEGT